MLSAEEYLSELKADEDQLEELEEELERASVAWDSTIRAPEMVNFAARQKDAERLVREIGSNYDPADQGVQLMALANLNNDVEGGRLTKEQFVDWYIRWMFTPEEGEGEFDEADLEKEVEFECTGNGFKDYKPKVAEEGVTWKCSHCKIMNKWETAWCIACDTKAPHFSSLPASITGNRFGAAPAANAELAGKFSFGTSGATFGAPAASFPTASASSSTSTAPAPAPAAGVPKFGSSSSAGFTFGAKPASGDKPTVFGAVPADK